MKRNSFILILFVLTGISLFSCEETNLRPNCETEDPLAELSWLSELRDQLAARANGLGYEIIQYTYREEAAFLVNDCSGCPDRLDLLYNCEGEVICEFGGIDGRNTCPDFDTAADSLLILDGINRIAREAGFIVNSGPIAADGCGLLFVTEESQRIIHNLDINEPVDSLPVLNSLSFLDSLPVLIDYYPFGDSFQCGDNPNFRLDQIQVQTIREVGDFCIDKDLFDSAVSDFITIQQVGLAGNYLVVDFSSSGCDGGSWRVKVISSGEVMESAPPQMVLKIVLDNDEACDAVISKQVLFNLSDLQLVGGDDIRLQIEGYPDEVRITF